MTSTDTPASSPARDSTGGWRTDRIAGGLLVAVATVLIVVTALAVERIPSRHAMWVAVGALAAGWLAGAGLVVWRAPRRAPRRPSRHDR